MNLSDNAVSPVSRASIADVARKAGVSKSTVSLALREGSRISAETRKKIQQVASELGYQRDPALAMVAATRWHQGVKRDANVVILRSKETEMWPVLKLRIKSACARLQALGYHVEEFVLPEDAEMPAFEKMLHARGVSGILLIRSRRTRLLPALDWDSFPVVCLGHGPDMPKADTVSDDVPLNIRTVFTTLTARGYERPCSLYSPRDNSFMDGLYSGLLYYHLGTPSRILRGDFSDSRYFKDWLKKVRPDVVIGQPEVYFHLLDAGYEIPRDFGFCTLSYAPEHGGELTGTSTNDKHIGNAAADLLDHHCLRRVVGLPEFPLLTSIAPSWHEGTTLPDLRTGRLRPQSLKPRREVHTQKR